MKFKIYIQSLPLLIFSSLAFAGDHEHESMGVYESVSDGGFDYYPFHPDGLVSYKSSTKQWYKDGLPAVEVDGRLVEIERVGTIKNDQLIRSVFSKLGFPIKPGGTADVSVVLDYTCPFSRGFYNGIKGGLSEGDLSRIEVLPISRNMVSDVIDKSLQIACLPKRDRSARYETLMDNYNYNGLNPQCENSQYLYGVMNTLSALEVQEVPAVFIDGVYRKELSGPEAFIRYMQK